MPPIRQLPEELIGKIAAGEVVERPSSVVKELVENSLDAGATEVRVELQAGGLELIRVADDGGGMSVEDAARVFGRHATSKISSFEDLLAIRSLGFRGEALASIAAVAHVEIKTADGSGEGSLVRADGGKLSPPEPAARSRGTTVEVASLFYNVPARRKFLKTARTETRRALEVVQGYALAHPGVRFTVASERGKLLDTLPAGAGPEGLRQRIAQIFGDDLAGHLLPLSRGSGEPAGDTRIWGFVGDPTTTRGKRQFTFVNRRLVRDRTMMSAFYRAVRETWHGDRFPALFLFLDLPSSQVDVNVHPQKTEVRFLEGHTYGSLFSTIRRGLEAGLGEVEAPAIPLAGVEGEKPASGVPFAWQGSGGRSWPAVGEVREGSTGPPSGVPTGVGGGRIAEAVYAPLERAPVPLSGDGDRSLRLLGQYKGTLILLEGADGLYLIDQHVAHERILYERFRAQLESESVRSQRLLEPVLLELAAAEAARLLELGEALEACGFALTELSGGSVAVSAVPAALAAKNAEGLLLELARGGDGGGDLRRRLLDALAASQACRAAVKMHEPLPADQLEALVAELFAAEQPWACPHGRPTVLKMTDRDLEKRFKRR